MTNLAALLAEKTAQPFGNATAVRGVITALREDGNVNVALGTSAGPVMPGIPCSTSYTPRAVGDHVQLMAYNGTYVVAFKIGSDPAVKTPAIKPVQQFLYSQPTGRVVDISPSNLYIGQDPRTSGDPTQLVFGYFSGTNTMNVYVTAHTTAKLIVSRSANIDIGIPGRVAFRILPHNSGALPQGSSIVPLTTFSTLLVNLEVGERKDISLPSDWVTGITAGTPTIKGFLIQPGQFQESNRPVDTTYSLLSGLSGGVL